MGNYCVQLDCSNFLIEVDGKLAKHGFITLKLIEADDPDTAVETAIQAIRDDQELHELVQNDAHDPPVMDVEEIMELESFNDFQGEPGRIWYEMHPKRWWQFWRR